MFASLLWSETEPATSLRSACTYSYDHTANSLKVGPLPCWYLYHWIYLEHYSTTLCWNEIHFQLPWLILKYLIIPTMPSGASGFSCVSSFLLVSGHVALSPCGFCYVIDSVCDFGLSISRNNPGSKTIYSSRRIFICFYGYLGPWIFRDHFWLQFQKEIFWVTWAVWNQAVVGERLL